MTRWKKYIYVVLLIILLVWVPPLVFSIIAIAFLNQPVEILEEAYSVWWFAVSLALAIILLLAGFIYLWWKIESESDQSEEKLFSLLRVER